MFLLVWFLFRKNVNEALYVFYRFFELKETGVFLSDEFLLWCCYVNALVLCFSCCFVVDLKLAVVLSLSFPPLSAGDYCEVNVCTNGGTCVTGAGAPFICICPDGFSGETCNETEAGKPGVWGKMITAYLAVVNFKQAHFSKTWTNMDLRDYVFQNLPG